MFTIVLIERVICTIPSPNLAYSRPDGTKPCALHLVHHCAYLVSRPSLSGMDFSICLLSSRLLHSLLSHLDELAQHISNEVDLVDVHKHNSFPIQQEM